MVPGEIENMNNEESNSDQDSGASEISAIMTVLNDKENVQRFFKSFLEQDFNVNEIEFVVVDAGSSDGTIDIIEEFKDELPNLKLIVEDTNRSEGRDLAIRKTSGDLILTFNSDVLLEEDCVKNIIETMKDHPEAGGIAAMQRRPEEQNFFAECVYNIPGMAQVSLATIPELSDLEVARTHSVPCECGIWRREALPEGLFDERLNWGEDTEFHSRMMEEGWEVYGTSNARFEHFYADNFSDFWSQQIGYGKGVSVLWKTVGKLESWGLSWKRFVPLIAPFALIFWLLIAIIYPLVGLITFLIAMLVPAYSAIGASKREEESSKFFFGVLGVQILKYLANVMGFWIGVLQS